MRSSRLRGRNRGAAACLKDPEEPRQREAELAVRARDMKKGVNAKNLHRFPQVPIRASGRTLSTRKNVPKCERCCYTPCIASPLVRFAANWFQAVNENESCSTLVSWRDRNAGEKRSEDYLFCGWSSFFSSRRRLEHKEMVSAERSE